MSRAYLGIGGNMGNKKENIQNTIKLLKNHPQIHVSAISSYYETAPVGYTDQDWFLNIVVEINTSLDPYALLAYCNDIEQKLKRERLIRWGPRTIDVDILLYEGFTSDDEKLTVPHPRMCERAFVMVPLYEIAKDLVINNKKIEDIIKNLKGEEVRKIKNE
ncbi:2-amino-4-hydroxy-6-hydroxymethyldihydropteridine diphosphokinase [Crassaminicella thermophila]|uniref:2-amino-4-hydroxy-6-hydroxymethyldihydropteridine diphosphokinase n=1 Tax=Crassaminicella thermophila TaxID=2599308 RepID=A0A5C0SBG3_CRATE|nr:2-amino-4-hydroxy-6-hydroxymethyldihydropteridine diphosphokinase [Crassaminicella thermophila]QEK11026.1 2-amino-4-hydroxy-6-hydroxymethyldihydropteridine diphosphokinase [Crassaminicella thermophila]